MSRIDKTFKRLAAQGESALITFITAGDPDLSTTERLIPLLSEAGADIIELGVPFSDPMADGPTIQKASERALASGTTLESILESVKKVRRFTETPLILMGYYNPVFIYGLERFAVDATAAGVDGVLLVDLPPEEAGEFKKIADRHNLATIFLLTPTSDKSRIDRVKKIGAGFIYYVSVTGVTGARNQIEVSAAERIKKIKGETDIPVVVGFGVSTPEQAGELSRQADGVVVGSVLVKLFEEFSGKELEERLSAAVKGLKAGMR